MGVGGDQSRKGRGDQRSSRRAALKQNVRDEVKIHWTRNIAHANMHTIYTYFVYYNMMALVFIFTYDHANPLRTIRSNINLANLFYVHYSNMNCL